VFDELLSNIISYAYQDDLEHDIEIKWELSGDRLTMMITDDGIPFNPFGSEAPDTSLSLEERDVGGLGVHLVKSVMDKVSYQRRIDKNVVTLTKRITGEEKS
jgi:sigma-B regulation protein RsbU (phosphoserine phosphatase)